MASLKEKVVLITGAGSGIGAGAARHFATLGSWLALNDMRTNLLENTHKECIELGTPEDKILIIPGDITAKGVPESLVSKTVDFFGKMDVLLNVAGRVMVKAIVDTTDDDYDAVMDVNAKAMFKLIRLSVPHLTETQGNIVNVSSLGTGSVFKDFSVYAMSKTAVDQLTKTAAVELAPNRIRVNSVNPGSIKTNIAVHAGYPEMYIKDRFPNGGNLVGRFGTPEDIAKSMAFLASDDASFITGINMFVDGGMTLLY